MRSRIRIVSLVVVSMTLAAAPALARRGASVRVTNGEDAGPGSFRAAVEAANADSRVRLIRFRRHLEVVLDSDVVYTGRQPLTIDGRGSALVGDPGADPAETWDGGLFVSSGGADLTIRSLAFLDSFNNGIGIFVPEDAGGTIGLHLDDVRVDGSRFHGVFFDGQTTTGFNTDDVIHPDCVDPHPFDSPASLRLFVKRSEITGNGTLAGGFNTGEPFEDEGETFLTGCPADFDGIRVDDGGAGSIDAWISDTLVEGNLADGIETDESGAGDVVAFLFHSTVAGNGETGTDDLDDGFDIDEAGEGDLRAWVVKTDVVDNRDEGLDFDEAGPGSAVVTLVRVDASRNEDQGFKLDEEGAGNLRARVFRSQVNDSISQDGIELTEEDEGGLEGLLVATDVMGNADAGVKAEQVEPGAGRLRIVGGDLTGNTDGSLDLEGVVEQVVGAAID